MVARQQVATVGVGLRRRRLVALAVGLVFALTACNEWWVTYDGSDPTTASTVLTPDLADAYTVVANTGTQFDTVALDGNVSGNLRQALWPEAAPAVVDQESCATWVSESSWQNQEGAVLRQRTMPDGSTQGLSVTKNIVFGLTARFNFHTWDTTRAVPFTAIGQADLAPTLAGKPFPWHFCARAVRDALSMKVWTGDEAEPAWGDPAHGASVTLAPEWVYPGRAGWYVGHLAAGDTLRFSDLSTRRYGPAEPSTTTTTEPSTTTTAPVEPTTTTEAPTTTSTTEAPTTTTSTPVAEGEVVVRAP